MPLLAGRSHDDGAPHAEIWQTGRTSTKLGGAMYLPSNFLETSHDETVALMRARSFANIVTKDPELCINAVPMVVDAADGNVTLRFHLALRNPQCEALAQPDCACVVAFNGPDSYVSPSWYEERLNVPTWNYQMVQARGRVEVLSAIELEALLGEMSSLHEAAVSGTYRYDSLPADFRAELLAEIRGFRLHVTELSAKSKLSQNRPRADQERVCRHLLESSDPSAWAVGRAMARRLNLPVES
jgi:transcriptional regulator